MVPAHFHDVTDDKMKSHVVKNTIGQHLNHSQVSLSLKKVVEHILTTRKSSCVLDMFKTFTTTPKNL